MARRQTSKLTALEVSKLTKRGMHADGGNLYIRVARGGTKTFALRYMLNGRQREMGLGSCDLVSLAEARTRAFECRRLILCGQDPVEQMGQRARRNRERQEALRKVTFAEMAERYIDSQRSGWKNEKQAEVWKSSLKRYAFPVIGTVPVQDVTPSMVLQILERESFWTSKPETASRVRNRIELVLDYASARELRTGDNPARWKGRLKHALPPRSRIQPVQHHPALPVSELPSFMTRLRNESCITARALEFTVLTAARTGEVINASWDEFNLERTLWTIPSARMKSKREHLVPLSGRIMDILRHAFEHRTSNLVFPSPYGNRPLSNMAMLSLVKRMGKQNIVVHGFRSTFRDWCAEHTSFSRDVCESALAHSIKDKTEASYLRSSLLEKRRILMERWALYCESGSSMHSVLKLREGIRRSDATGAQQIPPDRNVLSPRS